MTSTQPATPSVPTSANPPFKQLEAHPWAIDPSFQSGLSAILSSSSTPSTTSAEIEDLTLRARCFYYTRTFNVSVDFDEYKAWRDAQHPGAEGLSAPLPAPYASSLNAAFTSAPSRQRARSVEQSSLVSDVERVSGDESSTAAPSPKNVNIQPSQHRPQPDYPASFDEVVQMIQSGKSIPGVKDIPDTILIGQGTDAAKGKRLKPWERDGGHTTTPEVQNHLASHDGGREHE